MASEQHESIPPTQNNFRIYISDHLIPKFIGEDGETIFYKVTMPSIQELKKTEVNDNLQKTLDAVKDKRIYIQKRFTIKRIDVGHMAYWNDTNELGALNVTLNEIIKKNLTKECHQICEKNEFDVERELYENKRKIYEKEKKSERNFNYKIGMDEEWEIDQFIGNDDKIINEFKKKIEEELNVENVSVKILKWNHEMLEMYRVIDYGLHVGHWEKYFLFEVSFLGGEKSDILKVEKMIVDFVYINTLDNDDAKEKICKANDLMLKILDSRRATIMLQPIEDGIQ